MMDGWFEAQSFHLRECRYRSEAPKRNVRGWASLRGGSNRMTDGVPGIWVDHFSNMVATHPPT